MILKSILLWFGISVLSSGVLAAIDVYEFDTESQRQRYYQLVEELRCPKCQNQNLSGSNSQIAADLRRELYRLLIEGKTDLEIKHFMVDRYGDFVLYNPPLQSTTLVLWLLPLVLTAIGVLILLSILRQKAKQRANLGGVASMNAVDESKLKDLLQSPIPHSGLIEPEVPQIRQEVATGSTKTGAEFPEQTHK